MFYPQLSNYLNEMGLSELLQRNLIKLDLKTVVELQKCLLVFSFLPLYL